MNQQQNNYIKKRVEGICQEKMTEARIKCTSPSVTPTNAERIDLIRSGKVKMKPDSELRTVGNYGLQISTVFDFSKYEVKGGIDQKKLDKLNKKIRAEANRITDGIMVGDSDEALTMLRNFQNFKV